MFHNRARRLKP